MYCEPIERKMARLLRLGSYLILIVLLFSACKKENTTEIIQPQTILEKLNALNGVTAIEIESSVGYGQSFQIDIMQAIDHNNPGRGVFTQRIYLTHTDETSPMIFAPSGYVASKTSVQELANSLQTNCLNVTHRYFSGAAPANVDWSYLSIEQAAADFHRIVTIFKELYTGKWISSGGSKSGSSCLFHKYLYPQDVDATIAYVVPFTQSASDMRFEEYLENIGSSECFQKLKAVQERMLSNRDVFMPILKDYMKVNNDNYLWTMDTSLIFELTIIDYPFLFWQYHKIDCADIPTAETSPQEVFDHVNSISKVSALRDSYLNYYMPYYHHALTEHGAPGYEQASIQHLYTDIDFTTSSNAVLGIVVPDSDQLSFDGTMMNNTYEWLQHHGDHIIYIYGENDPWTAGAFILSGTADALWFNQPGENHTVKITDLDNPNLVYSKLEEWLGIDLTIQSTKMSPIEDDEKLKFK